MDVSEKPFDIDSVCRAADQLGIPHKKAVKLWNDYQRSPSSVARLLLDLDAHIAARGKDGEDKELLEIRHQAALYVNK